MRKTSNQKTGPKLLGSESGQAILEYVLMLMVAISVVAILSSGLKTSLLSLWEFMARQIAAACPGCPPPPNVRF
jgi:Flp pilus assembly pilin Flp